MPVILGGIVLLIGIFVLMPFSESHTFPAITMIFVWGFVQFAAGAPLQARVVDQAQGAPNLASTLNQGAFNLGNALGASLGGVVLTAGLGYRALAPVSAAVACIALCVALYALRLERREARANEPVEVFQV